MIGGSDRSVCSPPAIANKGSTTRRRRENRYISKACLACRTAKTRCDSRQPRCTHCEGRDLACNYNWEPKPRGPAADPLSARSEQKRRRIERIHSSSQPVRLHHSSVQNFPQSDSSASSNLHPTHPSLPLPMNVTTSSAALLSELLSLGKVSNVEVSKSYTEGTANPRLASRPTSKARRNWLLH
ncbi:hypothetical protein M427DRAFT_308952 [Gonapodya prolifera JEL478]|uniref:Zn(2)-C6 fungal-type domain-containing protein n=1 Tax=Gonapodya prolifera (strain JEL478) TaxID=1344416 RepID=A0A139AGD0_GONPJ|nr:hypothetical protein M427DRAFT_308952 [Gonapodya prolifera JEL478]|eukprot:KXS15808.1 hypothetical protein M427DRAFT_308952 [Gonapodya prolifera JEL478]